MARAARGSHLPKRAFCRVVDIASGMDSIRHRYHPTYMVEVSPVNLSYLAKAITTAIGSALTVAITYYPHGTWIPIASAIATVLATYAIPNTVASPKVSTVNERTRETEVINP